MLSIIIPTLNEENYLPFLLKSLRKQKLDAEFEIIVSDAGSEDKTINIAKSFGCKVIFGGFPAKGKNEGAKEAKGDLILFLDADTFLTENSLEKLLKEFKEKKLDIASFLLSSFHKFHNFSYKILFNFPSLITEKFLPQAMNAILAKKELHQKIEGFNEEVKIGEELDYLRRGIKFGKFGVLRSAKIFASPRRFEKDGWFTTWLKYFLCQLHMIFFGPVKSDILKYRFNHYSQNERKLI
jgi:glycosyltransferase involved in cell wall biosynthesis